jgi:hypothetical protein
MALNTQSQDGLAKLTLVACISSYDVYGRQSTPPAGTQYAHVEFDLPM